MIKTFTKERIAGGRVSAAAILASRRLRMIFLAVAFVMSLGSSMHAIRLAGTVPAANAEITTFDFRLDFDISDVIAAKGEGDWGIYASGNNITGSEDLTSNARLYKGTRESGTEIGCVMTYAINGRSDYFESGNSFDISFPGLSPEEGQVYTLYITLRFNAVKKGETTIAGKDYELDCRATPLALTFVGGKRDDSVLTLMSSELRPEQAVNCLNDLRLTFNVPVAAKAGGRLAVMEYGNPTVYAESTSITIDPADERTAIVSFSSLPLYTLKKYWVVCDEGTIVMKSDPSKGNKRIVWRNLDGAEYKSVPIASLAPQSNFKGVLSTVKVSFEMPGKLCVPDYYGSTQKKYPANLYKKDGDTLTLVGEIVGYADKDESGIIWENKLELDPLSDYLFRMDKGTMTVYEPANNPLGYKKNGEYSNPLIEIAFTTPATEGNDMPRMTFSTPSNGAEDESEYVEYPSGSKPAELGILCLDLTDKKYLYGGGGYDLKINSGAMAALYKLTESGEREKVKDVEITVKRIYTDDDEYKSLRLYVSTRLYEGMNYQLVIPAGSLTVNNKALEKFVSNDEVVFEYGGSSVGKIDLRCTTMQDGARLSSVSAVSFICDNDLVKAVTSTPRVSIQNSEGKTLRSVECYLLQCKSEEEGFGKREYTRLIADFSYLADCMPYMLPAEEVAYQIVVPGGLFSLAGDPEVKNKETVINILRVSEAEVPEYVTLTSTVNEHASTLLPVEKGMRAKVRLIPTADWKIESVKFNGRDVTEKVGADGVYETAAMSIDSRLDVNLAYAGEIYFEDASGVAEIPGSGVRAYSDGDRIAVEGLTPGDNVKVYTMAGVLVAEHDATADIVRVNAAKGSVYIIAVTGSDGSKAAVKIHH